MTARQLSLDVLAQLTGQVEAGRYRYLLWRAWGPGKRVLFVLLSPSTATDTKDDPTIRRCRAFARAWCFDGFDLVNIFALRSTNPKVLYEHPDPIGPLNDQVIADAAQRCAFVMCAWGNHGRLLGRGVAVVRLLCEAGARPRCFRLTKAGQPEHPLYQPGTREPVPLPMEDS